MAPPLRIAIRGIAAALLLTTAGCHAGPAPASAAVQAPQPPSHRVAVRPDPDAGAQAVRSLLNVETPMRFGDYVWDEAGVPAGPIWVRVDLSRQLISVFRGGHEIGTAVILYGGEGKPTPVGQFAVLQKAVDYHSRSYDAEMPFMLRLTADGVAIHASDVRPGWATHGCVGVPREFARRLYAEVNLGDRVVIG
jgi:hypothetical protein